MPERPEVVVEAAGTILAIALKGAERLRRICAQHVVAADRISDVVQQRLQAAQPGCRLPEITRMAGEGLSMLMP